MNKISVCLVLVLGIIFSGCAQKKVVQPKVQQPTITMHDTEKLTEEALEAQPAEKITEHRFEKIESKEEPIRYLENQDVFEDIYFDFDEYGIRDDAKSVLDRIASWLLKHDYAKILIEGHCDIRGTNEYNLALGDRRAKSTRDYLVALGVAPKRIEMLSYGEEKQVCTDDTEDCWAKNRRAHFVVLKEAN
jgi:peptidoglycan-associated lipoprotein